MLSTPQIGRSVIYTYALAARREDGSFLRAQNLQIGYTLGAEMLEKLKLAKLRLYVSVSNAFTLTRYRGYDPTSSSGAPIGSGFDPGFYPTPRTYLFGANIKL